MATETIRAKGGRGRLMEMLYPDIPEYELPVQDEDTSNSNYLTFEIDAIREKGQNMFAAEERAYKEKVAKIEHDTGILASVITIAAIALTVVLVFVITDLCTGWGWALLAAALFGGLGYLCFGLLCEIVQVEILERKYADRLSQNVRHYVEQLRNISEKLQSEAENTKEMYFSRVVDAQFKYGKNNKGIGVLADWCCEQLMQTVQKGDHRQFLERVYAKIRFQVFHDRVELNATILTPESTASGMKLKGKDLDHAIVFVFQENCIYNLNEDLFTLVGCAQALCTHITEKMGDVLVKNEYDPDANYRIETNDNTVNLSISVPNPKFIPFQDM